MLDLLGELILHDDETIEDPTACSDIARHACNVVRYLAEDDRMVFTVARNKDLLDALTAIALVPKEEASIAYKEDQGSVRPERIEGVALTTLLYLASLKANLSVLRGHELLYDVALEAAESSTDPAISETAMSLIDLLEQDREEREAIRTIAGDKE
ncbi:hypothetical protein KIPB_006308 [Kipferlia bialata]|uniref:Uncharacterized protein n=1 Tax=Kipferlia bialata TaxID=797122 RepID=A0A9K3CYH1_9EUKA|nr:hypothetical protein KIPB_006308 [Kipferlia bialata]|eukprot:g6308.t1